jgi:hypothetical protein
MSTCKVIILVSRDRSEKQAPVPQDLELPREFANSLDERPFVQRGTRGQWSSAV